MIRVERCLFKSMGFVVQSEIATSEFPLLVDEVKPYVMEKDKEAYMAKVATRAVGHVLLTFDKSKDWATIDSIGVYPKFRRNGVGTQLVTKSCMFAGAEGFNKIRILVPSYQIDDKDDPWNVEQFLWRTQFKAVGTGPECWRYGKNYDWYIFERSI